MAYSQAWLESTSVRRCILVEATIIEVGVGAKILYFSSSGYITTTSDVYYLPLVVGGLNFTENLSLDGKLAITYGDVELTNTNGDLDLYLNSNQYIWVNGSIQIYYGDPSWVCTNSTQIHDSFLKIFDGVIVDIASRTRTAINIKLRDKLQRLNAPLTENKLGFYGTWSTAATGSATGLGQTNADAIIPIVFGEVFNMSPMLIDPLNRDYYINRSSTEYVIDVRDNGIPLVLTSGYTINYSTGILTLVHPATGTITASIQGQKISIAITDTSGTLITSYNNNIASIIALITTQFGTPLNKLSLTTDIDWQNFNYYYTNYIQPIGVVITDRQNTLQICNEILDSIAGQLFCTKAGKLQILILGVPISTSIVPTVYITTSDIINPTLAISSRTAVVAATKLGYAKNWTVQPNIITAIPQQHKDSYNTEYLTCTSLNTTIRDTYKLNTDPIQKDTVLLTYNDAKNEADRLNSFYNTIHTVFSFTGTARLMSLQLGQRVNLTHPRFGLSGGLDCQVISLSYNWTKGLVDIEVITL
jgi:hypothetical protein